MHTAGISTSKYVRPVRNEEELNRICGDSFRQVNVPESWKFKEYERVRLTAEPDSEIQCISAVFVDKNTSGAGITHYRLNFHTYSERLSLTEVTFEDFGKPRYVCLMSNCTAKQMNENRPLNPLKGTLDSLI